MGNKKYKKGDWVLLKWTDVPAKIYYVGESFYDVILSGEDTISVYEEDIVELVKESDECGYDMGDVSDGYHTFNELYEYRLLYNASMFNELAKQGLYDVHKSRKHSDGEYPFGDSNWFIVMAELPTGQISNHYEMKDWYLFDIPEKEIANVWDGHTPKDVAERLRRFLTPKPVYPKTYEECFNICYPNKHHIIQVVGIDDSETKLFETFIKLKICRDAYWKIAGDELRLGKPWEPDFTNDNDDDIKYCIGTDRNDIVKYQTNVVNCALAFPTDEMRDAFYENFKFEIEICKELL